jgi:hypothetical protein
MGRRWREGWVTSKADRTWRDRRLSTNEVVSLENKDADKSNELEDGATGLDNAVVKESTT